MISDHEVEPGEPLWKLVSQMSFKGHKGKKKVNF